MLGGLNRQSLQQNDKIHPTRSMHWTSLPTEVCPIVFVKRHRLEWALIEIVLIQVDHVEGLMLLSNKKYNFFVQFSLAFPRPVKKRTYCDWFGLVLWHINSSWLFYAKYSLHVYVRYMICKHILLITFLDELKRIHLNGIKYCYVSLTIQLNICYLFTQSNDQTVLFLTIQFSINHLFAHGLNVKQFYLTHRYDHIRCYLSGSKWTWEQWLWRGTPHSPDLQHYCCFVIRLFNVIFRTLIVWVLPFNKDTVGVLQPRPTGMTYWESNSLTIM